MRPEDRSRAVKTATFAAIVTVVVLGVTVGLSLLVAQGARLTLTTERFWYRVGDTVSFVLRNEGDHSVILSNPSPWVVRRMVGGSWERVEEHASPTVLITLPAGGALRWEWEAVTQTREDLVAVEGGLYRIDLTLMDCVSGTCSPVLLMAMFRLL